MCVRTDPFAPHAPRPQLGELLKLLDEVADRLAQVGPSAHIEQVMASVTHHRQRVAQWLAHPPSRSVREDAAATILGVIAHANTAAHAAFLDTGSWRPVQAELRAAQHEQPDVPELLYFDLDLAAGRGVAQAILSGEPVPAPLDWLPRAGTTRACEVVVDTLEEPLVLVATCLGIETPDGVLLELAPASPRQRERLQALLAGARVPERPAARDELPTLEESELDAYVRRQLAARTRESMEALALTEEDEHGDEDEEPTGLTRVEPASRRTAPVSEPEESKETCVTRSEVFAPTPAVPFRAAPQVASTRPHHDPLARTRASARAPAWSRRVAPPPACELPFERDTSLPETTPPPPMLELSATLAPPRVPRPPAPSQNVINASWLALEPPRPRPLLETQELPDVAFAKRPVGPMAHHSDDAHIAPLPPDSSAYAAPTPQASLTYSVLSAAHDTALDSAHDTTPPPPLEDTTPPPRLGQSGRYQPPPAVIGIEPPPLAPTASRGWLVAAALVVLSLGGTLAHQTIPPNTPAVAKSLGDAVTAIAQTAARAVNDAPQPER